MLNNNKTKYPDLINDYHRKMLTNYFFDKLDVFPSLIPILMRTGFTKFEFRSQFS